MKPVTLLAPSALLRVAAISFGALVLASQPAVAQQVLTLPSVSAEGSPSVEQLESSVRAAESFEALDEETRARLIEQLRDAQGQVRKRISDQAAAAAFSQALESAAAEAERLREMLEQERAPAPTAGDMGISEDSTLEQIEQALANETAKLAAVEARQTGLESQLSAQESRPAAARARLNELSNSQQDLAAAISAPAPAGQPQVLTDARKLAAELRRAAQAAEITKLEQELSSHGVRQKLLNAQLGVSARARSETERRVELLRTRLNAERQAAAVLAQQATAAAEMAAAEKHPVVRALAEGNTDLTEELPAVAADIERATEQLNQVESEVGNIEQRMARSRQRLDVGGMSRVIGRLLIDERRSLPQVSEYRSEVRARRRTLASIGLAQVRIDEQRRELSTIDASVEAAMAEVARDVSPGDELESIRSEVRLMLRDRKDLLEQADNTYRSYLQVLGDLDIAQRRLLASAARYQEFLDQNLMWIPSAPILGTGTWQDAGPAIAWALSPRSWLTTTAELAGSLREHVAFATVATLLLIFLILTRRPLTRRYKADSAKVGRLSTDNIGLTLTALAIAALRALPMPLMFAIAGWLLNDATDQSAFSRAVAGGLFAVSPFLYNVLLFRALSARNGVARVHFGWRDDSLATIRRQLDRLAAVGVPLAFATVLFYESDSPADRATMGRLAYIALMVVLSLVNYTIAHPERGVAASYYNKKPHSGLSQLRWLWYAIAAGTPLMLGLLAIFGYLYTSAVLTGLLVDTIWLALGMIVANMVVLRWLALARRKIAWQMALDKRAAQKAEKSKAIGSGAEPEADGELPAAEVQPLDLDLVDQQTRKIMQSGLFLVAVVAGWAIWSDVLPAFNLLNNVALWSQTAIVDGVQTIVPVTVANVLLALVIAAVTFVASKNLPGLMEIAVLQRLDLQPGSRYAINTILRYFVVTVGTISVLSIVGWDWSQIQWLVAALSVGLGFGLQEIVANFVSGLIILFERPVRVGDTVTVGELTGSVSRIRIRATTITDWDRKEIIVPNKSFITEQVINWTLSDPITRVVVPVGISYGSDFELAHKVMEETLRALPLVLDEPPPKVWFLGFGESSLDFKLYVYSRQLADRLPLMHAVHESILNALRKHGIEIPFPQRDLHLRSTVESEAAVPAPGPRSITNPGSAAS